MPPNQAPPPRPGPLRVLILEDVRFDRQRLARLCARIGGEFDLAEAPTLARAADLIDSQRFDLVLLDHTLPDGTGLDALDMLRLSQRNCTAPTIMISGQDLPGLRADALSKGCSGFITKDGLQLPTFKALVRDVLGRAPGGPDTEPAPAQDGDAALLMRRHSADCARRIKPMVSRMMRQLRTLRSAPDAQQDSAGAVAVGDLEQTCTDLWQYLIELEAQHSADLAASSPSGDGQGTHRTARRHSLFGRA